ncbi:Ankyrin repeat protein family-like protein [Rhynchospora pubera]|uniref:Ankyrin repeat protein family-like protein n=1 Tax=Rhynchospora pubera TaxID=906938 RepID=A0AAV8CYT3_9POAL|nr:Ankyrin repeat protein family-like protein [Rhynchospora pubera]
MVPKRTLEPELYEVIRDGNIGRLEEYVKRQEQTVGTNIANGLPTDTCKSTRYLSAVTYAGDTVLHIAARFGQRKVAERICRESLSLLWRANSKSETPLHYAAQAGNLAVVTLFIREATDQEVSNLNPTELLRKRNRHGETALYQAVHHEHKHVVEELMRADSNLASIPDEQNTSPLYLAMMLSSLPIVTSLVELLPQNASRGAYTGPDGRSALHAAALRSEGFVEQSVSKLPELTKARDNSGRTPLHYGASAGNLPAVRLLLEKDRTSAYIADSSGSFPVHDAAKSGHLEVLMELIMKCPDSDELLDGQGKNFLHLAVEEKRVSVVQWVCKNVMLEKAMNAQDGEGNTPLHLAVKAKDKATFAYLTLNKKVHLNWVNKDGLTPLDIACALVEDEFLHSQVLPIWQVHTYIIL